MKVINIRRGFATNSSSSHSLVFVNDSTRDILSEQPSEFSDFGWSYFVQMSFEEKLRYIVVALHIDEDNVDCYAEGLGVSEKQLLDTVRTAQYGYIDHESVGLISSVQDAYTILHNDNVAIVGGNDNSQSPEWHERLSFIDPEAERFVSGLSAQREKEGVKTLFHKADRHFIKDFNVVGEKAMTSFDPYSGEKVRYNLKGDDAEVFLETPELVDIKITDYCPYGCTYCYQNSTLDGLHAKWEDLSAMVEKMKRERVFELAIGGGEPTLYPHFMELIDLCRKPDEEGFFIVPNFTTRNLSVFKGSAKKVSHLLNSIGGFAYSIDNKKDVNSFFSLVKNYLTKADAKISKMMESGKVTSLTPDFYHAIATNLMSKVSFQVVLGVMSEKEYTSLLEHIEEKTREIYNIERDMTFNDRFIKLNTSLREAGKDNQRKRLGYARTWTFDFLSTEEEQVRNGPKPTVMLLGYKSTGRGSQPTYDYTDNALSQAISVAKKTYGFSVGIDTACAIQMKGDIKRNGIHENTYYDKEGVASCYIDAVAMTMASSSYCPEVDNNTMDTYSEETFIDNFSKYQKKGYNAIPVILS